jgi:hypothetical protein
MKDYRKDILSTYFTLLNDSVIVDGSSVYVGSVKVPETEKTYVRYYIAADSDVSTFDSEIREIDVTVDCVTFDGKHRGDDSVVDSMVEQVKTIINRDTFGMNGWYSIVFHDMGTTDTSQEGDEYDIISRSITLKHIIEKK